jgi:hypothetical protein
MGRFTLLIITTKIYSKCEGIKFNHSISEINTVVSDIFFAMEIIYMRQR